MLHVQVSFPLQPPFLITTADMHFSSTCQMQFQDTGSLSVTPCRWELEINNDIPVGAFLIPNSVQLLAHDHMDVLKHYALIKCSGANVME